MERKHDIIFVTIGVPFSRIPIAQKVMLFVDLETGVTPQQVAKGYRKAVADNIENHGWVLGTNFDPSDLYYEIFHDVENTIPFARSDNSPNHRDEL